MTDDAARDTEAELVPRVMLRPIASSLPLGFLAFTVGTVLLSVLELSWVPVAEARCRSAARRCASDVVRARRGAPPP